ncbi:uncharacterized protein EV420DRAFT_1763629 [Desarmillaria tabescens]|uniref:F-box domain-containing protein n=1 Tax=Armillaria tabescens TaxID=1929756 RepID=A0AA39KDV7_ARMTA|nr:uncharacterized protein EV420DRAFT_1763629 [Desarmillaria tabescens]KAK0459177.1 hypothetical protein EV420DRAFT_1763629 [Desarmillaria tabescens]
MISFPPELMLRIFGYLEGSRTSLEACCLVCHAWLPLAQPLVFADLSLTRQSQYYSCIRKFTAYPHLTGYVTSLTLGGGKWPGDERQVVSSQPSQPSPLVEPPTLELIRQFTNVRSLKIYGFPSLRKTEIEVLCRFPQMECLEMCNVAFEQPEDLLDLTSQMVGLKSLGIAEISIGESHQAESRRIGSVLHNHVDPVPKRLRHLYLQDITHSLYIFSWLSGSAFDLSGLTELTLLSKCSLETLHREVPQNFPIYVAPFISIVGVGIKHLCLDMELLRPHRPGIKVNHMLDYCISTAALENFTALETLDIRSENPYVVNDASCLHDIQRLLRHVTFRKLWNICIAIHFVLEKPIDFPFYQDLPVWADLDNLLGSPNFPSLLRVVFDIDIDNGHWYFLKDLFTYLSESPKDDDEPDAHATRPVVTENPWPDDPPMMDDVVAMIKERMPTVASRGLLEFCLLVDEDDDGG